MKKVTMGGYTGRENRGCEAIAKSTSAMFRKKDVKTALAFRTEYEFKENSSHKYFDELLMYRKCDSKPGLYFKAGWNKLFHNTFPYEKIKQGELLNSAVGNTMVHIGGDTYCYGVSLENESLIHWCKKLNIPVVLWAASIEECSVTNERIMNTLKKYDKLYIREKLTYDILLNSGFDKDKLFLTADPAFTLEPEFAETDEEWWQNGAVGINISPIAMEENPNHMLAVDGCLKIIEDVLSTTRMNIMLVPHVYMNDFKERDYEPLNMIKERYADNDRVRILKADYSSSQLKYIISKCSLFVAARTHASIAAYSSLVPTFVLGYSVKAKGIATDLFGDYKHYVLPVQELKSPDEIFNEFKWIQQNRDTIRAKLETVIPEYKKKAESAADDLISCSKG